LRLSSAGRAKARAAVAALFGFEDGPLARTAFPSLGYAWCSRV